MNTNTKEFRKKVQNTIINDFNWTRKKLQDQFTMFTHLPNDYARAKYLVEGGAFDCYYNQVAHTMSEWFECSENEIWQYYKDDSAKMWESYMHLMALNICRILDGKIY